MGRVALPRMEAGSVIINRTSIQAFDPGRNLLAFKSFGKDTSFERAAQPLEIAPVFVFLASNEARFVTGEVYGVTGGQTPF